MTLFLISLMVWVPGQRTMPGWIRCYDRISGMENINLAFDFRRPIPDLLALFHHIGNRNDGIAIRIPRAVYLVPVRVSVVVQEKKKNSG